uniref:Uncharacterized protein n=1 Tax=Anguilla anguilla TaxID=7936 RepID=A0A0E9WE33_ANGAN
MYVRVCLWMYSVSVFVCVYLCSSVSFNFRKGCFFVVEECYFLLFWLYGRSATNC